MTCHSVEYESYIRSPEWRRRRRDAIARAGWRCERCPWRSRYFDGRGLHVHHRHYDTLGHEGPEDLEVLCRRCHAEADEERAIEAAADRAILRAFFLEWAA